MIRWDADFLSQWVESPEGYVEDAAESVSSSALLRFISDVTIAMCQPMLPHMAARRFEAREVACKVLGERMDSGGAS